MKLYSTPFFIVILAVVVATTGATSSASKAPTVKHGSGAQAVFVSPQAGTTNQRSVPLTTPSRSFNHQQPRNDPFRNLIRVLILMQVFGGMSTPTAAPETTATTGTTAAVDVPDTTPDVTTTTTTVAMVTLPDPFNSWYEYKGCRYLAFKIPRDDIDAQASCTSYGSGATLAQMNVRTVADRGALMVDGLGLPGRTVWLGLKDIDGDHTANPPRWLNGDEYTLASTDVYTNGDFSSIALGSGFRYENIIFVSEFIGSTSPYVCEYCPP